MNQMILPDFDLAQFEQLTPEPLWQHNARWIKLREPEKYQAICLALVERLPIKTIASALSCSRHTVRAVRDNEPTLAHEKPSWLEKARDARDRLVERFAENVDELDLHKIGLTMKFLHDMVTLAEGGVTARVEHVNAESQAERELRDLHAVTVRSLPEMGFEAKNLPHTAPRAAALAGAVIEAESADLLVDNQQHTVGKTNENTGFDTESDDNLTSPTSKTGHPGGAGGDVSSQIV
jgi:hypothetical protein